MRIMNRVTTLILMVLVALVASAAPAVAVHLITGKDVRNNSLTGQDIRNGTLGDADLNAGVRTKLENVGKTGPQGPQGERGTTGPTGIQGPVGPVGSRGVAGQDGTDGKPGKPGADGSDGTNGTPGTNGTNGRDGVSGLQYRGETTNFREADGTVENVTVSCGAGKTAIGGGFQQSTVGSFDVLDSYPSAAGFTVRVILHPDPSSAQPLDTSVTVHASCITG